MSVKRKKESTMSERSRKTTAGSLSMEDAELLVCCRRIKLSWKQLRLGIIVFCIVAFAINVSMLVQGFISTLKPIGHFQRDIRPGEPRFPEIIVCNYASARRDMLHLLQPSPLLNRSANFQHISQQVLQGNSDLIDMLDSVSTLDHRTLLEEHMELYNHASKHLVRNFNHYSFSLNTEELLAVKIPPENFILSCQVREEVDIDCSQMFTDYVTDRFGVCQKLDLRGLDQIPASRLHGFIWGIDLLMYLPDDVWTPWVATGSVGARITLSHAHHPVIPEEAGADIMPGQHVTIKFNQREFHREEECRKQNNDLVGQEFRQKYSQTLCLIHCYNKIYQQLANCSASHYFGTDVRQISPAMEGKLNLNEESENCFQKNCPQPCLEELYDFSSSFAAYPSMHEGMYLLAKTLLDSEHPNTTSVVSREIVARYRRAVDEGKRITCPPESHHTAKCNASSFKYAVNKCKKFFSHVHIYRESKRVSVSEQYDSYSIFTLISNIGAQLGLWCGVTFVSLYDWVVHYVKHAVKKRKSVIPSVKSHMEVAQSIISRSLNDDDTCNPATSPAAGENRQAENGVQQIEITRNEKYTMEISNV